MSNEMVIDFRGNEVIKDDCISAYAFVDGRLSLEYRLKTERQGLLETFHCKHSGKTFFIYMETVYQTVFGNEPITRIETERVSWYVNNLGWIHKFYFNESGDYFECEHCGDTFQVCDLHSNYDYACYNCGNNSDNEDVEHVANSSERLNNQIPCRERGSIIKHVRRFGIELETGGNLREIYEELPAGWSMVSDSSCSGKEVVSNILQGKAGEEIIKKFCNRVQGFSNITRSDGFHVHFDAKDFKRSLIKLRQVIKLYKTIEKLFFKYLPPSRQSNTYCKKLDVNDDFSKRIELDSELYETKNKYTITREKSDKYSSCRYYWLNIHSLYYRGTFEIRAHSGTMDYNKICEWVNINGLLIGLATNKKQVFNKHLLELLACGDDIVRLENTLFDILKLSESSRDYFRGRRKKFEREVTEGQGEV